MSSQSEVGHAKNAANYSAGIQILQEMGTLYNPSNPNIKIAALTPIETGLTAATKAINEKKPIYKNAVADKEVLIAPFNKLITRTLNSAKSVNISPKDKENLESQAKKLRGTSKAKPVNPETADADSISTSQLSYDNRIANLDTYIGQLASHPEYVPNETELQITSLKTYHSNLKTLSSAVNASGIALITAQKNRNEL